MTNPTPYDQLRQLLEAKLDLPKYKLCKRHDTVQEFCRLCNHQFIVPTLQDILCVMGENPDKTFTINTYGEIAEECYVGERTECVYDLTKSLADQDSETLLAIISLLQ